MLAGKELVEIRVPADPDRLIVVPVGPRSHRIAAGLSQEFFVGRRGGGDSKAAQDRRAECALQGSETNGCHVSSLSWLLDFCADGARPRSSRRSAGFPGS